MKKILIVDDSERDREIIKSYLHDKRNNFSFLEAESVDQALASYEKNMPDCTILDFNLLNGRATDFLEKLKHKYDNHKPVIVISGVINKDMTKDSYEKGAVCIFDKNSLSPSVLRGTVEFYTGM
jgi:response regulator RpfG family c-di-GMP phosphodiesterase